MNKLLVAFSHTLTADQIDGFTDQYGATEIFLLKDVALELQAQASDVPPGASIEFIEQLAHSIVKAAVRLECTHFYFAGEPALFLYTNNRAHRFSLVCVQSTTQRLSVDTIMPDGKVGKTSVYKHVQWRELF